MCGIAGILASRPERRPRRAELVRMAEAIAHRGPDGAGAILDRGAGFAHARLALVDRANGAQPFGSADGRHWIVFNGEIYNHRTLREALAAEGVRFRTRSDTEVLLESFRAWGDEAWPRLEGQFAAAILDRATGRATLARDRFGIAPLFVAEAPGALLFASEAKAILASGRIAPRPSNEAIHGAFRLWSPPPGLSAFEGIEELPPGHARTVDADGRCRETVFATPRLGRTHSPRTAVAPAKTADDAAVRVERALRAAVRDRLPAEQPLGAYLSGGVDSALLVRCMQLEGVSRPTTLGLRFGRAGAPDARFDEGDAQREAAARLGTDHREIFVDAAGLAGALPDAVWHAECPLLRAGPAPMLVLARAARDAGLRAVLAGEGADEVFAGYDVFREARLREAHRGDETHRAGIGLDSIHATTDGARGGMWRAFFGSADVRDPMDSHAPRWRNGAWSLRFLAPEVRDATDADGVRTRIGRALPGGWERGDAVERAQEIERATFLSTYLLAAQGDRALMASGVEGRYPYLDGRVVAAASGLAPGARIAPGPAGLVAKATLRAVARRHLPAAIAERPKRPYRAPIAAALLGPAAPGLVRDLLSPKSLARNPLVDARTAGALAERAFADGARLSEREEIAALGLATLELWRRTFLEGDLRRETRPRHVAFTVLPPFGDPRARAVRVALPASTTPSRADPREQPQAAARAALAPTHAPEAA